MSWVFIFHGIASCHARFSVPFLQRLFKYVADCPEQSEVLHSCKGNTSVGKDGFSWSNFIPGSSVLKK